MNTTDEVRRHGEEPHDVTCEERPTTPPNPCGDRTAGEDDCDCHKSSAPPQKPKKPSRKPRRPADDCCQQLIDMLSKIPGIELPKPHKPKQRPARKVSDLCNAFGIQDALVPLIVAMWERHTAGAKPRNEFEETVDKAFAAIAKPDAKAFSVAVSKYREFRKSGKGECLFNDCLSDASERGPIEASWVTDIILREGLKLAGQQLFNHSNGEIGPGQARLWDNTVFRGPNGSAATIYQGPWPWLTAISPNHESVEEFGNLKSFRPIPGQSHAWEPYQYATECTYAPSVGGKLTATCARQHPTPPAPGGFITFCEGGQDYTHAGDCIRIPSSQPGSAIALRGFNFITPTVKVRAVKLDDPSIHWEADCPVWGDQKTPLKDDTGHFIVDERVSDGVSFPIAPGHPNIKGAPLPAGLYEVSVEVANATNVVYDSATPPILLSNKLLLRIEADPNVKYLFVNTGGACNQETSGLGSDEIWWDAFVGHIAPIDDVVVPANGQVGLELKGVERRSIPRGPWDDMDDGEGATPYSFDIWGAKPFELGGVAVVGMVGYEVDSEDAANQQLQGFWNAWGYALKEVVGIAFGASSTATGIAGLAVKAGLIAAKAALTAVIGAVAIIAVVAIVGTMFWAAWAPADLVALDIMHMDSALAWDRTDPKKPLPPPDHRYFGDPDDDDNVVNVTEYSDPKDFKAGDAVGGWKQHNQYDTPESGEDSSYTLHFTLNRSA